MPDSEASKAPRRRDPETPEEREAFLRTAKKAKKAPATKKAPAKKAAPKSTRPRSRGKALETPELSDSGNEVLGEAPPARQNPTPDEADNLEPGALDRLTATLSKNAQEITRQTQEDGNPVLLGHSTVALVMDFDDAVTPADAVRQFIETITQYGLESCAYVVRDDLVGDSYIVQHGEVVEIEVEDVGQG